MELRHLRYFLFHILDVCICGCYGRQAVTVRRPAHMKPRPTIGVDRASQILALWTGRPREQRRPADIDSFCQWLVDYAPWLVPGGVDSREQIRTLIHSHTIEEDTVG